MIHNEEFYRDKLVDWMIKHDIATGSEAPTFDDLLKVIGAHVNGLKKEHDALKQLNTA